MQMNENEFVFLKNVFQFCIIRMIKFEAVLLWFKFCDISEMRHSPG